MTPILIPAGNPSAWTGPTGNNTWLLPGTEPALVDAGVGNAEHVEAVDRALARARRWLVLITHWHPDHVDGRAGARGAMAGGSIGGSAAREIRSGTSMIPPATDG